MNKSKVISYGGISAALSILLLYLTNVIPVNKMFFLGISSCIMILSILLIDFKNSIIVYIATSLLALILNPNKDVAIAYIILFGLYPFIKSFVEKKRNIPIELLIKLLYFNISIFSSYIISTKLFVGQDIFLQLLDKKLNLYIVLLILQGLFVLYDFVLTAFVGYSYKSLLKKLKK